MVPLPVFQKELAAIVMSYVQRKVILLQKLEEYQVCVLTVEVCCCCQEYILQKRKFSGTIYVKNKKSCIMLRDVSHHVNVPETVPVEDNDQLWQMDLDLEDELESSEAVPSEEEERQLEIDLASKQESAESVLSEEEEIKYKIDLEREQKSAESVLSEEEERQPEIDFESEWESAEPDPSEEEEHLSEIHFGSESERTTGISTTEAANAFASVLREGNIDIPSTEAANASASTSRGEENPEVFLSPVEDLDEFDFGFTVEEIRKSEFKNFKWRRNVFENQKLQGCCYWHEWEEDGKVCPPPPPNPVRCDICGSTVDNTRLDIHRRSFHNVFGPIRCSTCSFETFSLEVMAGHIRATKGYKK